MIGLSRLTCAIADVPTGGMQTGSRKVVLKLADAQRIKAELEGVIAERDALAREVDECNERIGELTDERDQWYGRSVVLRRSLGSAIQAFNLYEMDVDTLPTEQHKEMMKALNRDLDPSEARCMREVRAEAGRAGFIAGADAIETIQMLGSSESITDLADAYAAKVRQGGA